MGYNYIQIFPFASPSSLQLRLDKSTHAGPSLVFFSPASFVSSVYVGWWCFLSFHFILLALVDVFFWILVSSVSGPFTSALGNGGISDSGGKGEGEGGRKGDLFEYTACTAIL